MALPCRNLIWINFKGIVYIELKIDTFCRISEEVTKNHWSYPKKFLHFSP